MINQQIILKKRPSGMVSESDFEVIEQAASVITNGEILIENKFISLDPAMRGWMNEGTTYIKGVEIGAVMRAFAAGKVIESKNDAFPVGMHVTGILGAQKYAISDGKGLTKIEEVGDSLSNHIGILGMPGMTAYFGLLKKGEPQAGETVFVSGASGVVGSTVGQIARIKGCRVVGTAGSEEKCRYLVEECGFDAAINYKTEDLDARVKETCPDGIHIIYDNVGGPQLDILLANLARGARVVICGAISQYNSGSMHGPKNYMKIVTARGHMNGIIVFDYIPEYPVAVKEMSQWIRDGKMKNKEHIVEGLENFPSTLKMLFTGGNFGKLVLKV